MGAGGRITFPPIKLGELAQLVFDFSSTFEDVSSAINAASCTITVWTGTDSNPSAMLSGSPVIITPSVGLARKVTQNITTVAAGVAGVIYAVSCQATTASGLIAIQSGYFVILPGKVP